MGKLIAVAGRTLIQSNPEPSTVTFTVVATDIPAAKTNGSGNALLVDTISLECKCSGTLPTTEVYEGTGSAQIVSRRQRVRCEGEPLLLVGDRVRIECSGMASLPGGTPREAQASVTVTIGNGNQPTILANES